MMTSRRVATLVLTVALTTGTFSGAGVAASAAPAHAASCAATNVGWWSAKNSTCSSARHFNIINAKTYKYAPWVGKGKTSSQSACWDGATHYGVTLRA